VTSPVFDVRPGLPPTLIAAGSLDHLVPFGGHVEIVEKLNAAGVPNVLLSVPYGEHAYDLAWAISAHRSRARYWPISWRGTCRRGSDRSATDAMKQSSNEARIFLAAEWRNLVMLNYEVDPHLLRDYVPLGTELDSHCGGRSSAWWDFSSCTQDFSGCWRFPSTQILKR